MTQIINGRVIRGGQIVEENVYFEDGMIISKADAYRRGTPDRIIDAKGNYVSAGFIDLHVHGGGGYDFLDGTEEAFRGIAEFHGKHGTTALCPTATSGPLEDMIKMFNSYKAVKENGCNGADFVGMHMEGPYFALSQMGAQDPKFIRDPDPAEYERILEATDDIVRWSIAPERDTDYVFASKLSERGIWLSAAHTDVNCREMQDAKRHGYTHMTHFYSCMKSVERVNGIRIAGAIEAAYLDDDITVEIIADGMHLPPELLQMVYKIKGPDRTALITDAMRAAGAANGTKSILGSLENGMEVYIERDVAWVPGGQAFAGSIATTDRLVRTVVGAGIPLVDAVKMASETPAKLLGCTFKGTLDTGKDADIVIFDEDIRMQNVFVKGREISL
ncbi:MAG: N-acetylglucosamine-6-phosphate deacetylase [Ruminococcaceae bacterium]|nr:N-acetylglucosamine-6-phosphate deacetylase [Oscillospiraceae bacterium]